MVTQVIVYPFSDTARKELHAVAQLEAVVTAISHICYHPANENSNLFHKEKESAINEKMTYYSGMPSLTLISLC